jgi:hypothetical protein
MYPGWRNKNKRKILYMYMNGPGSSDGYYNDNITFIVGKNGRRRWVITCVIRGECEKGKSVELIQKPSFSCE